MKIDSTIVCCPTEAVIFCSCSYVVTAVSSWKTSVDNGYWLWTFQGRILKRVNLTGFNQLLWRPRPATLLTPEQIKDIKKNLKKYSAQFESKDRMRLTRASKVSIEIPDDGESLNSNRSVSYYLVNFRRNSSKSDAV